MSAFYFSQRVSIHLNYLVLKTYLIEEMKVSSALGNSVVSPSVRSKRERNDIVLDVYFCLNLPFYKGK